MKIIVALLFLFAYVPNLQIYSENFIVHDYLAILVLMTLMVSGQFLISKTFLFTALLCALIIAILIIYDKGNSWLILARAWVYLSIPMLAKDVFRIKHINAYKVGYKNNLIIKNISFLLIFSFLILHFIQFIGYLPNPFQMDYYIRALGVPMDEDYYKYAWFDEHHVAAPALLSLMLLYSKKSSLLTTWFIAFINGSRMMIAGSFLTIFFGFNFLVKLLITVFIVVIFVVIFNYTDHIQNFNDLQLRLRNWALHLSYMSDWHDFLFGYGSPNPTLEKVPIDNFLVRYICNLGAVGMIVPIVMLSYIFYGSSSIQKFFVLVYTGAALFNDLFAYPPSLAVFCGSFALMVLSEYIDNQSVVKKRLIK